MFAALSDDLSSGPCTFMGGLLQFKEICTFWSLQMPSCVWHPYKQASTRAYTHTHTHACTWIKILQMKNKSFFLGICFLSVLPSLKLFEGLPLKDPLNQVLGTVLQAPCSLPSPPWIWMFSKQQRRDQIGTFAGRQLRGPAWVRKNNRHRSL